MPYERARAEKGGGRKRETERHPFVCTSLVALEQTLLSGPVANASRLYER